MRKKLREGKNRILPKKRQSTLSTFQSRKKATLIHAGIGVAAGISLLLFYFIVSSLLGGFAFAIENFQQLWYWMLPLIVGFGVQIGLFSYVKSELHRKASASAAASTGISTGAMVACCAHHLADIAPFLGIAAAGVFLTKYQSAFLLLGVVSNILGITYMLGMLTTRIPKKAMKTIFYSLLAAAMVIVGASFASTASKGAFEKKAMVFSPISSTQDGIEFLVAPESSSVFDITINTHAGSLDFEMVEVAMLRDDLGNKYLPLAWEGSAPGGHHRRGILRFPTVSRDASSITLAISESLPREFTWDLQ